VEAAAIAQRLKGMATTRTRTTTEVAILMMITLEGDEGTAEVAEFSTPSMVMK